MQVGSVQLEFKYLAYQTGKRKYYETVDRVVDALSGFDGLQVRSYVIVALVIQ